MENQIYILLHSQADSKYLFCIICELNIVVVLNEKYISIKQRSVIIRLCLVYKCMKKKATFNWNEVKEKLTPIFIRERYIDTIHDEHME